MVLGKPGTFKRQAIGPANQVEHLGVGTPAATLGLALLVKMKQEREDWTHDCSIVATVEEHVPSDAYGHYGEDQRDDHRDDVVAAEMSGIQNATRRAGDVFSGFHGHGKLFRPPQIACQEWGQKRYGV